MIRDLDSMSRRCRAWLHKAAQLAASACDDIDTPYEVNEAKEEQTPRSAGTCKTVVGQLSRMITSKHKSQGLNKQHGEWSDMRCCSSASNPHNRARQDVLHALGKSYATILFETCFATCLQAMLDWL